YVMRGNEFFCTSTIQHTAIEAILFFWTAQSGSMPENRNLKIRKYPNRRYYDTTRSRHLTLEQIHDLVRDGYEIQISDSRTGADLTAKVLAQILLELDSPKLSIFPAPLLHRLIRANEQLFAEFTDKYFNQALSAFLESQKAFESYLRQTTQLGPIAPSTD